MKRRNKITHRVRKIWSHNPDLYKWITLREAYRGYLLYARYCMDINRRSDRYGYMDDALLKGMKSFRKWLKTEI